MGYYINPKGISKEQYLEKHGETMSSPSFRALDKTKALVCLVDNGRFTAAGICYSNNEFEAFNEASDDRPKRWFSVPKQILIDDGFITKERFES